MLRLHRATGSGPLVQTLTELLAEPLSDPFAADVVVVESRGLDRWLAQQLSTRLGGTASVAANIRFPRPAALTGEILAAVADDPDAPAAWAADRLPWAVLRAVEQAGSAPWAALPAAHVHRGGARFAMADEVARTLGAQIAWRPGAVAHWATGSDVGLPADLRWQAELYRVLRAELGPSPAELLPTAAVRLRERPDAVDLPERLAVFAPSRLAVLDAELLRALSAHRDVDVLWPRPVGARHPLLRELGGQARGALSRLEPFDEVYDLPVGRSTATVLGAVRDNLYADTEPSRVAADRSIMVHTTFGRHRQVEVLRDVLADAMARDETLEPRDALVVCADPAGFTPLLRAAFGSGGAGGADAHPARRLRVRIAEQTLRQANPVLDVLTELLTLVQGRVTADDVLDLAATDPVRRRFGFDDDALSTLREWLARAGGRWGFDQHTRGAFGMPGFPQNTLRFALDRLLLGIADASETRWLGVTLGLAHIESTQYDLVGRFAEYLDRLQRAAAALVGEHDGPTWGALVTEVVESLTAPDPDDAWSTHAAVAAVRSALAQAGRTALELGDVRALLDRALAEPAPRAPLLTGDLTVVGLEALRTVPHRLVVLLGFDADVFPRTPSPSFDDPMTREPQSGEADVRTDDRLALLDAVTAATEQLVVIATGADPVSGAHVPPAPALARLVDTVTAMTGAAAPIQHPLQPFDPRAFAPPAPVPGYDPQAFAGARAAEHPGTPPRLPNARVLAPVEGTGESALDDLLAFVRNPPAAFARQRLGLSFFGDDEQLPDTLAVGLDSLEAWGVGNRLLDARLAGVPTAAFYQAEARRGTLPPFAFGAHAFDAVAAVIDAVALAAEQARVGEETGVDVRITVGSGTELVGTVEGIFTGTLVRVSASTVGPRAVIAAWVELLAAAAAGAASAAVVVGKRGKGVRQVRLTAPADPVAELSTIAALHRAGLRAPLVLGPASSWAYARRLPEADAALLAAEREWSDRFGEHQDAAVQYCFEDEPFARLAGWERDGVPNFTEAAVALWSGALEGGAR